MKLCTFLFLSLLLSLFLLVPGVSLSAVAQLQSPPEDTTAPTTFSCDAVTEIPKAECEALKTLYNDTNGADWVNKAGWLDTSTPCSWYGVTCAAGHVTMLDLGNWSCPGNNLRGTIPAALANLTGLTFLRLGSNTQLTGPIPPELGNLANLRVLFLAYNQLTGPIPPQLGDLTNLTYLHLSENQLTGVIPPKLGSLTKLQNLYLSGNQFTGTIPPGLGDLTDLRDLFLQGNQLTGGIPFELGALNNLKWLILSNNPLTGAIPPQLGNLRNLEWLYLAGNQLTGPIPSELGNLTKLQDLSLSDNYLIGTIPPQLGNLQWLRVLYLSGNQLTGPIPPQLGNLVFLQTFVLARNGLEGEVPSALMNPTNLGSGSYFGYTDIGYNVLTASNSSVIAFLDTKDPDWAQTQTVAPGSLQATPKPVNSVELTWTPIPYAGDSGYYEVGYSATPGGPYNIHGWTSNKSAFSYVVSSLLPGKTYYFAVRTYTPAHGDQQNNLLSGWSREASAAMPAWSISGRVVDGNGVSLPDVTIVDNAGHAAATDSEGNYSLHVQAAGAYTIRPSRVGYTFVPPQRTVNIPPYTIAGQDFTGTFTLSVSHLEITQVTQDESNTVPLIAGKPTFVRAYVDCGNGCSEMPGVTGVLRAYGTSGELPKSPKLSVNSSVVARHEE